MALAAGFLGGLSLGLGIALCLCVWWVKKIHASVFEDESQLMTSPQGAVLDDEEPQPQAEEEQESDSGEWWKH